MFHYVFALLEEYIIVCVVMSSGVFNISFQFYLKMNIFFNCHMADVNLLTSKLYTLLTMI